MVGIATSYRLDGLGSISRYFQFSIPSVFLCINVLAFCTFCITVTHSVFCTTHVLLLVCLN
jgi:hypothetical protein